MLVHIFFKVSTSARGMPYKPYVANLFQREQAADLGICLMDS